MMEGLDRTFTLDPERLEQAIDVLQRARKSFGLTGRERITYRVLLISGDVAMVSYWVVLLLQWTVARSPSQEPKYLTAMVLGLGALIFGMSILVGTVALLLNLPVFLKTWRERAELKSLGLSTLSTSLWRERRRHRWLQRIRGILLLISGVSFVVLAITLSPLLLTEKASAEYALGAVFAALVGLTLLAARYLRNRREQIELAANAERLRETLGELRRRAGGGAAISIPAETLEQVARIESAQIARERRAAILEGAGSAQSEYAVLSLTRKRRKVDVRRDRAESRRA